MATVPAPAALTVALTQLLYLDGRTMPDSPDRAALLDYVGASRWLRFALGVGRDEPMPQDDDAGIAAAADAARLVAAAPARAAARAEAEAAMAAAEDDAGAAERALRNWSQRLGITADAIDDIPWAARERAAESDFARRSVAFRTAEREVDRATATLRALGFASAAAAAQALDEAAQRDGWRARVTELDAVPARTVVTDPRATRPLVVCAPVAAGQLAGISAPLAVVVVTNDNALAVAARATGVEVIDARRDASAPLAA